MKKLQYAILHCLATREGREVSRDELRMMHYGPARNKDGTYTYRGVKYPSIAALPDTTEGGVHIRVIAQKFPGRGWSKWGYEKFQHLDGKWEDLVQNDNNQFIDPREVTNGALGINGISRHFAYVGGCDLNLKPKDTRTKDQLIGMQELCYHLVVVHPHIEIGGHNQFSAKACPSFDVPKWLRSIGIPEANICKKPLLYKL